MLLRGMPLPFLVTSKAVACGERLVRDYSKVKVGKKVWWQEYGKLLTTANEECLPEEEGVLHRGLRLQQQQEQQEPEPLQQQQQQQESLQQQPLQLVQEPLQQQQQESLQQQQPLLQPLQQQWPLQQPLQQQRVPLQVRAQP